MIGGRGIHSQGLLGTNPRPTKNQHHNMNRDTEILEHINGGTGGRTVAV